MREQLATKQADELLAHTFDAAAQPGAAPTLHQAGLLSKASELRFQGIVLVHTLVKRMPHWLPSQPAVLQKLIEVWLETLTLTLTLTLDADPNPNPKP